MKTLLLFCMAIWIALPVPAQSENAGELQRDCEGTDATDRWFCQGYLLGIANGRELFQQGVNALKGEYQFCLPDQSNLGQWRRVFEKYMQQHPEREHEDALTVLAQAWAKAFPCDSHELRKLQTCPVSVYDTTWYVNAKNRVEYAQILLEKFGFDPGEADGAIGPKTRAAIQSFQATTAWLKETGELDFVTYAHLLTMAERVIAAKQD